MSEDAIENIIGFIVLLWIISWGARILHNGILIFKVRGFSHFMGRGPDPAEAHCNNRRKQWKKAAKAFGVRVAKLKKMSKKEIKDLYRKMAMKHHPDKGGDPDKFRNVHDAYEFAYAA